MAEQEQPRGVDYYRRALEKSPNSAPIQYNLALALLTADSPKDRNEARTLLRAAADAAPEDADALSELGRIYISEGKTSAAVQVLDEALSRNPTHPAALNNRGVAAFLKARYPQAVSFFRRAVEADSGLADGWFNLADALMETGDEAGFKKARKRWEDLGGR